MRELKIMATENRLSSFLIPKNVQIYLFFQSNKLIKINKNFATHLIAL